MIAAMDEAMRCASSAASRYALDGIQLDAERGRIVGTDGRRLYCRGGFAFPWDGSVHLPRTKLFGLRDLRFDECSRIGRSNDWLRIEIGDWRISLRVRTDARYPDIDHLLEASEGSATMLEISDEDAHVLGDVLPSLPGSNDKDGCLMLLVGDRIVLRAEGPHAATDLVLDRSRCDGLPQRLGVRRCDLADAIRLGHHALHINQPGDAIIAREWDRAFVFMSHVPMAGRHDPPTTTVPASSRKPKRRRKAVAV